MVVVAGAVVAPPSAKCCFQKLLGCLWRSSKVIYSPAYYGKPLSVLICFNALNGKIQPFLKSCSFSAVAQQPQGERSTNQGQKDKHDTYTLQVQICPVTLHDNFHSSNLTAEQF